MSASPAPLRRMLLRRLAVLGVLLGLVALTLAGAYLFAPQLLLRAVYMQQAAVAHVEKETIIAGDTRWSYYAGGDGPPLVLLHGFSGSKENWLPAAKFLTRNFRVIVPDLPGWGESSRDPQGDYGYAAQAARLEAFAQALRLPRFALAGHSMGGAIAGLYAAAHPGEVAAVAFLDSAGVPFKENDFARAVAAGHDPFAYVDRAGFERLLALVFATPPSIPGRIEDAFVAANGADDHGFLQRVLASLRTPEAARALTPALPKITAPALVLWCAHDRVIDVSAMAALRAGLTAAPRIDATLLMGCGHMPMLEQPSETADALTRFLLLPAGTISQAR